MTRVTKEGKGWWLIEVYENGRLALEIHQRGKPKKEEIAAAERQVTAHRVVSI